jgi:hypothetical protein
MKQITNNNQFARKLKKLLIKGWYYSIQEYLNEEFSIIDYYYSYKQKYVMYNNIIYNV